MPERARHFVDATKPPSKKIKVNGPTTDQERQGEQLPANRTPPLRSSSTKTILQVNHDVSKAAKQRQPSGTNNLKERAKALLDFRKQLPIWPRAHEVRGYLWSKDVLLLVGETGSGKSTQVAQFLVEEPWCNRQTTEINESGRSEIFHVGGCIAITEPRRVAAITLARRVAEEMGTPLGSSSPASKVGYSVRFDNSTSPSTKIKFLTEGMLLREILRDPWLKQYSAVIIDEVHERGVNVDLVLGFMRNMVCESKHGRGGVPLKVVVMSATADLVSLLSYFEAGYEVNEPNKSQDSSEDALTQHAVPIDDGAEASDSEWSGISSQSEKVSSKQENNGTDKSTHDSAESSSTTGGSLTLGGSPIVSSDHVAVCHIEGRQFPVQVVYSPQPVSDFVDAALRTIFQIHYKEPLPGDILVFLTGQETVENLETLIHEYALNLDPEAPKLLVLPLFAALPQAAQQKVFYPTPHRSRKVILATNIAETSVTVSGVRFVIDCGKSKIKQFRPRLGLDSLLVKPISKSSAIQRKGRAGREAPGKCYRLYTEQDYLALPTATTPEILRCDLTQAILIMKARGITDVMKFPLLDRPPREALEKAFMQLFQLGALEKSGSINDLGLKIAELPLTSSLGRVLLAAADPSMDCLAETIDIISCLSVENIFLNITSEETKERAETARRSLLRREGDHLTLLATVQAYMAEKIDRRAWAEKHFVSHRAMQAVMVPSSSSSCI
jgi:ATP-dependent RNA helicase DHR2